MPKLWHPIEGGKKTILFTSDSVYKKQSQDVIVSSKGTKGNDVKIEKDLKSDSMDMNEQQKLL